eukprot:3582039-Prymnesium_polylepis.2
MKRAAVPRQDAGVPVPIDEDDWHGRVLRHHIAHPNVLPGVERMRAPSARLGRSGSSGAVRGPRDAVRGTTRHAAGVVCNVGYIRTLGDDELLRKLL